MWFRLLLLALGTFAIGTDGFVIAGILPNVANDLGVSLTLAGFLVTAFALAYALGSPVLAALTGTMARQRLLLLSIGILTLANILAAVANNYFLLFTARMIAALSSALYTPSALTVAAVLAPQEKRGQALSIVSGGLSIATVAGVPLGILISTQLSWRATFLLVAGLCVIAFIGILVFFPPVANPQGMSLSKRLAPLRQPTIVITLVNAMFWITGSFIAYTYLSTLLEQLTHLQGASISVMFLLFGAAGVIGNIIGGYGADHWGAIRTLVFGLIGLTAALFALPLVSGSFLATGCVIVVWGMAGWVLLPPQQHRLVSLAPQAISVVLSLSGSGQYLGIGIGAALGALVVQYLPLSALGWVAGAFVLLALIILSLSVWLMPSAAPSWVPSATPAASGAERESATPALALSANSVDRDIVTPPLTPTASVITRITPTASSRITRNLRLPRRLSTKTIQPRGRIAPVRLIPLTTGALFDGESAAVSFTLLTNGLDGEREKDDSNI